MGIEFSISDAHASTEAHAPEPFNVRDYFAPLVETNHIEVTISKCHFFIHVSLLSHVSYVILHSIILKFF